MRFSEMIDPAAETAAAVRVLVVEDEFLIRMLVAEHLRDSGFTVIEAMNADEAIAILTAGALVDIIFSDVRMPGAVDGMGLLDFIRRTRPSVPVVMTSGHLEPRLAFSAGAAAFLSKPCDLELLEQTFHAALETAR